MKKLLSIASIIFLVSLMGCISSLPGDSMQAPPSPEMAVEVPENPVPGNVNTLWAEPMYDTVRIPAQLDPTATYYRLPHNTVLEIRSEKYQQLEYPDDTAQEPALLGAPGNYGTAQ